MVHDVKNCAVEPHSVSGPFLLYLFSFPLIILTGSCLLTATRREEFAEFLKGLSGEWCFFRRPLPHVLPFYHENF